MKKIIEKLKKFIGTPVGIQVYSFVKTYVTLFIGIYLTLQAMMSDPTMEALKQVNLIDIDILSLSFKGSFLAILRNVYKLLTEK